MTRKKFKTPKDRLPKWAEADAKVVGHLMHEVAAPSICMLGLSNLLRADPLLPGVLKVAGHKMASIQESREFLNQLLKGGQCTGAAAQTGGGLVT